MRKSYVAHLMGAAFKNNLSKKFQISFQQWFMSNESQEEKQVALLRIWDGLESTADRSTERELAKLKRRIKAHNRTAKKSWRVHLLRIAAVILLPIIGAFSFYKATQQPFPVAEPQLTEHFTSYGEQKKIVLPDSSEVWLNAGSLLVYEKQFAGKSRSVYLIGEASFEVRKDIHPFIVKTKEINIEVLGTAFTVQSYSDDAYSITTLERGKVRIIANEADCDPVLLLPNEQLVFNKSLKTAEKKTVEAAKQSQWKQGYLIFRNSDFDYMMRSIERRFNVKINYTPEKFEGRCFTIRFSPEEDLNQVLDLLKKICGFKYEITDNSIYISI